jgi:regulator of replication initiation timing
MIVKIMDKSKELLLKKLFSYKKFSEKVLNQKEMEISINNIGEIKNFIKKSMEEHEKMELSEDQLKNVLGGRGFISKVDNDLYANI